MRLQVSLGNLIWKMKICEQVFAPIAVSSDGFLATLATQSGKLILLDTKGRQMVLAIELNSGPISRGTCIISSSEDSGNRLIQMTNNGILFHMELSKDRVLSTNCVYKFPEEVFSPLVIWRRRVITGCRDNHVHCLRMK